MAEDYCELANFPVPETWKRDDSFDFSYVDLSVDGSIATVTINRPEAMNALNETVVEQLGKALDKANANEMVDAIVLDGAGKAFVAGADVKFFVDKIRADSFPDIYEFTANGHTVQDKLESSTKTTIALTTGLALGGGLELALSCDYRIGTRKTQFRFPETNIGIFPGLGGTQRPARICGIPAARWAVLAGNFMDSKTAADLGLVTNLVDIAEVDSTIKLLKSQGKPANKYPGKPSNPESKVSQFAESFYSDANIKTILSGNCPDGFDSEDKAVARQMKSLSRTAPIALSMASNLIDIAGETDLQGGLSKELENLEAIFSTNDALEGLSALIEGRKPTYQDS
jgi:enoyl-CoA hydratase/3-hydroxyacyl-CoA dehydrogenase